MIAVAAALNRFLAWATQTLTMGGHAQKEDAMPLTVTRRIGDAEVTILTDGAAAFGPDLFPGTDPARIAALLADQGIEGIATNFNAVLIRTGGRVVLADAGARDLFGAACGQLPAGLAEAGVTPEGVDVLFATHMHPDHIAGMITPGGAAVFPNAELVVPEAEAAFWSDASNYKGAPENVAQWGALARAVLAAYDGRVRTVAPEGRIAPGLTALPLPGHTPGHSGWRLEGGLVHVGDIVHAPALQVPDPEIAIVFDMDRDAARAQRKRLLDMIATDGLMFTGGHFLHPAFHRLERAGAGYRLALP
jgi:glyoxylase-like metal-dependent hydrolase (beta-lactamase superfamily II)